MFYYEILYLCVTLQNDWFIYQVAVLFISVFVMLSVRFKQNETSHRCIVLFPK